MAKGMGKRIANALAIGIGTVGEGYGKAKMALAMEERQTYHDMLKEKRAEQAAIAERGWREGEAEKERTHDFEKMEKAQEYDVASQERTLQNQLTLAKMRGTGKGGGGGGKESAYMKRAREKAALVAKSEGREVTDDDVLRELNALGPRGASGDKESSYMKRARELTEAQEAASGKPATAEDLLRNLEKVSGGRSSSGELTIPQKAAMTNSFMDVVDPYKVRRMKDPEGVRKEAEELANKEIRRLSGQESEAEVPQSQTVKPPATSTHGDKPTDATPPGQGTKASPFMATTPAQQQWVLDNAPSGSFVSDGTKVFKKP